MMADDLGYGICNMSSRVDVCNPNCNGVEFEHDGKRPFLIAVGGGTASGKVSKLA